jgi:hypothetical protein
VTGEVPDITAGGVVLQPASNISAPSASAEIVFIHVMAAIVAASDRLGVL